MDNNNKKIAYIVKKNLQEMAMEFEPGNPSRPDPGVERKLTQKDTPLKKIPFPSTGKENVNFQELLASERYKQVVNNVARYVGQRPDVKGMQGMGPLVSMMMNAHNTIVRLERNYRTQLEKLAIDLVTKTMGISQEDVEIDAKIVGMGEITTDDFKHDEGNEQNPNEANIEIEKELASDLDNINLEKAKRRLINSIVQGASKRGHFMYHMVEDELRQLTGSDQLLNLYGIMMSTNDLVYWQMSDDSIKNLGGSVAGKEKVESPKDENSKGKITVRAINFPVLVHELVKGVLEMIALHGRPEDDDEKWQEVEGSEDTLEKEMWDLRLGPAIWDRLRAQMPDDVFTDETKASLQTYIFMELFSLPSKEFLVFVKEVVSGSPKGKKLMGDFVRSVERMLNDEDYSEDIEDFKDDLKSSSDDIDDDDLYGFLGDLGIDKPTDN